jgi:hypothetical protein
MASCAMSGVRKAIRSAPFDGVDWFGGVDLIGARVGPAFAAFAHAGDDVVAAVAQVLRMRAALAAIAEHGDARVLEAPSAHIVVGINFHHEASLEMRRAFAAAVDWEW